MFPRDMVCLRNVSVDTVHKGETEDNNNNNKGATGTIAKSFRKYVSNIPKKHTRKSRR
jgi:hypothetical protein